MYYGSQNVINSYFTYKKLKPIINPDFSYDDEEIVLFTSEKNISFTGENCFVISEEYVKNAELISEEILEKQLQDHFNINYKPQRFTGENLYYVYLKESLGYKNYEEISEESINLPTFFFKEIYKIPKDKKYSYEYIMGKMVKNFKKTGNHKLIYYYKLLKTIL